jgi:hypothetical protein
MKYFNHLNLIPYIDVALMDTYTLMHNPKFMNIAFTLDCSLELLKEKLKVSKSYISHI